MLRILGVVALVLCSLVFAAPSSDNIALARKYAPQWRFHTSEIYWPSTIEYFLNGVKQTDAKGNVVNSVVTNSNVDGAPGQGSGLYLSTDINSGKKGFLRGQNPSTTSTAVYTFIAPKDNGVVDLFYWLFTPFNEGKSVPLIGEVGDHVGDWERMTVRTVNGVATQVDYHAHGATGSGTIPWSQVAKFDNGQRPVGWVAKGSHGFWASAGTFTYVNAVVLKLQDITSNGGVAWDTRDSLVSFRYPDSYTGAQSWLNYKGYWGNIGQTNCWWYVFHKECEIVTGPDGPVRAEVLGAATFSSISEESMQGTLSQVLGTTSTESTSSFTFYIDSSIHSVASKLAYTRIAVKQTCIPTLPTMNDAVAQASTTFATTPFTAASQFTISPKACAQDFSVTSYTVGVCADSNQTECVWGSPRALRAYSSNPSVHGVEAATAIIVSDLDNWRW